MDKQWARVRNEGYEQGYDEGRVETLFRVREKLEMGMDVRAYIQERLQVLRKANRIPEGLDRDA